MWFCHHCWSWGTKWGVLLASPLCCSSNNVSPRCSLRQLPIMPCVLSEFSLFRVEPPTNSLYCMFVLVMVFAFCFQVPMWLPCLSVGAQPLLFAMPQPYGVYPWHAYVPPGDGPWRIPRVQQVTAPSTAASIWELYATHSSFPQPFHQYGGAYSSGTWQSHPIHLPSVNGREGSSFPSCVSPKAVLDSRSVMGIKPGDSGVVIWYQVVEFTEPW